jgi:hypothetical protein
MVAKETYSRIINGEEDGRGERGRRWKMRKQEQEDGGS